MCFPFAILSDLICKCDWSGARPTKPYVNAIDRKRKRRGRDTYTDSKQHKKPVIQHGHAK